MTGFWRKQPGVEIECAEHSQDLTDIASQCSGAFVRNAAIPLHNIVLRGVPDERITDRCIGALLVVRYAESGHRDRIENRTDGVQPRESVEAVTGIECVPLLPDRGHHCELFAQTGFVILIGRIEYGICKTMEARLVV